MATQKDTGKIYVLIVDPAVQVKCEDGILHEDSFMNLPVTNRQFPILYRNPFCAQCNGDTDIIFWQIQLECERLPSRANSTENDFLLQAVQFAKGHPQYCGLKFDPPVNTTVRTCKSHIGRCDRLFKDKHLRRKCKKSTSYAYVGLTVFKNKYCAECNFVNETYLSCEDTRTPRQIYDEIPLYAPAYSIVLDLNGGLGAIQQARVGLDGRLEVTQTVTAQQYCPQEQVYDYFTASCRSPFCQPHHQFINNQCVPLPTTLPLPHTDNNSGTAPTSTYHPISSTKHHLTDPTADSHSTFVDGDQENDRLDNTDQYLQPDPWDPHQSNPFPPHEAAIDPPFNSEDQDHVILDCPIIKLNHSEFRRFGNHSIYVFARNQTLHPSQFHYDGSMVSICQGSSHSQEGNLNQINRNMSMANNATCHASVIMFNFTYLQSFISFIGGIISLMALLIMLGVYLLFSQLRSSAGKCVMNLALALLVGQGLFVFGLERSEHELACFIIGAVMHWSFLVCFFWLNVLAIEHWKTYSREHASNKPHTCRFICYCVYAWCTPTVIVTTAVSMDILQYADDTISLDITQYGLYQPCYSHIICWPVTQYSLLFFFVLPLGLLLTLNLILFVATIRNMHIISQQSLSGLAQKEKGRGKLLIYIQLTFLMALTWIFAFVATITEISVLWFVFIGFNTLQGIFICFAFVCNKKVFRIVKNKGKNERKDQRYSNGHRIYSSVSKTPFPIMDGEARIIAQETSI